WCKELKGQCVSAPQVTGSKFNPGGNFMRLWCLAIVSFCLISVNSTSRAQGPNSGPLFGFNAARTSEQRVLEARFDSLLNKSNLREWMKLLTSKPHHLGSIPDRENAEWIASQFKSWGFDTQIERFDVLFPTPKTRVVELVSPHRFKARLEEPALAEDST